MSEPNSGSLFAASESVIPGMVSGEANGALSEIRRQIDEEDAAIVMHLVRRLALVKLADEQKKADGLPVRDLAREASIRRAVQEQSGGESAISRIFSKILDESRQAQGEDLGTPTRPFSRKKGTW